MITCGGCDVTWAGLSACHCSMCHRTFSGVTLFDLHRDHHGDHGSCRNPRALRLGKIGKRLVLRDGVWHNPPMTEIEKRRRFAAR